MLLSRRLLWAAGALLGLGAVGLGCARLVGPRVRAWYHLRAARSELARWHNPQAVRHLKVCLEVWPRDPDVLLPAARAARRARSYAEAEELLTLYQEARGLDEAGALEQTLLSAERRVDQVEDLCWRYVQQGHPQTPLLLEALTRGYLRQYHLPGARACLNRWLEEEADNPQALCLEGLFHLDYAHARTAAEASYRRALEVDPEHEEARLGLAVALLDGKKYDEAGGHFEYLRLRQPDNLSVQVGLAECRSALGQADEAARLVDDVLARQPQLAPALALRGRLALEGGQPAEAEAWLRQALARDPGNHRALYSLILCLRHNGKEAEAQRRQRQLDRMEEDLARFDEIVTKEMPKRPNDPALHYTLGRLLLRGGHRKEGVHWLQSALRLDPQYAPARRALAEYQKTQAEPKQPSPGP